MARIGTLRLVLSVILVSLMLRVHGIAHRKNSQDFNLASRMREISKNLEIKLNEMMASQAIKYTFVNTTGLPYNASTKVHTRGMGEIYNFTNYFIDLIQSRQFFPEGLINLIRNQSSPVFINRTTPIFADPVKQWKLYVKHYGILAGVALAGLLLAVILPCVGLFFCCCRCAGHCGARSEPFDKKHDHCRKVMLNTMLIIVATVLLLCVVSTFVTNERVQDGTRQFPARVKVSLKDVSLYLTTTKREIDVLLKQNFEELEVTLNNILQASGKIVTEQLAEYSHAVSLMNLNDIVSGLNDIRNDLRVMKDITQKLRSNAAQLDNVVRGVKNSLLHTLADCALQDCKKLMQQYKINQMSVQVDFDRYLDRYFPKLPDLTPVMNNLTLLMDDDIVAEVSKGKDSFMKIQRDIQHAVNQTIPVVSASIRRAGDSLAIIANNLTAVLDRVNYELIEKDLNKKLDIGQEYIDEYSPYRHYIGLAMCGVLLSILTCVTFGLLCGICGKRPDGYDDDCCDKGNGSRFLMMAVWLIFLLTSILMILVVVHMIFGIAVQRGVCEPLRNPKDNRVFALLDEFLEVRKLLYPKTPSANITLKHIMTTCHTNQTLYRVLMMHNLIELNTLRTYIDRYDINKTINQLRQKISLSPGVVIFSEVAKQKLNDLANSGLSDIKFYQYTENLRENITNINLEHLAEKLKEVSEKLPHSQSEIKGSLDKNAFDLVHYHRDLVIPMQQQSEQLSHNAMALQEHIKFNHSSMADAIHDLVREVTAAQDFLNRDGPQYVQLLATKFGDAFITQVYSFLEHVINNTRNNIGKCGPLSNAYNSTMVAACNRILDPFNGFWASAALCILLFIPTIILCVKLSGLYQKSDPYPGALVEAEYLYDAYADRERDNVPLAHINDKKYSGHGRHLAGGAYPESYEGPGVGYGERDLIEGPQGSSRPVGLRYDVGSKSQWDFPGNGPPGYQPALPVAPPLSTEYERPPPYYYPGPGDRN